MTSFRGPDCLSKYAAAFSYVTLLSDTQQLFDLSGFLETISSRNSGSGC